MLPPDPEHRQGPVTDPGRIFVEHYRAVAPALFAWAAVRLRRLRQPGIDAEDLVQEVCCRAFDRIRTFDPAQGPFRAWIFGIANNVLREELARIAGSGRVVRQEGGSERSLVADLPDEATSVSRRVARDEALNLLIERLCGLDEDERRLLIYRGIEGLSHADVAQITGLSLEAVQKRWQRLLDRIAHWRPPPDLFVP